MKWFWLYVLLAMGLALRCSQDSCASDSTPDQLCDMALTHHFPAQLHNESFKIRPYLRGLIEEDQRMRISIPMTATEPCSSPHTPLVDLIVRAYHKALLEKEDELKIRENALVRAEHKLEKKVSKSATVGFSALTGLLTSVITLIITIVSK